MRNLKTWISATLCISLLISCNREPSLQKYFVDHQDDTNFISVDVPSSLLINETLTLNEEEKEALKSVKKVNLLLLPVKSDELQSAYEKELANINTILQSKKYETLIRFGSDGTKVVLKSIGEEDNIDEVIVFATDQEKGLALVRILGDNMKPEKMIKLARSVEQGKLDLGGLKDIAKSINFD